jgi:hypothetical protein
LCPVVEGLEKELLVILHAYPGERRCFLDSPGVAAVFFLVRAVFPEAKDL